MKRKGTFEVSMNMVIYIIVLLAISAIIYIILNGRATGTEEIIKGTDPSLGSNSSKIDYCTKVCNDNPTGAACLTVKDPQMNDQTCREFLDHLAKTIEATYPEKLGEGENIINIALTYNGAPITGGTITGPYITDAFDETTTPGVYQGTISTTNIQQGYVTLTVSADNYPSKPITMLVDKGAKPIQEDEEEAEEETGVNRVILCSDVNCDIKISSVKAGEQVYVKIKVGMGPLENPVDGLTVILRKGGVEQKCNLGPLVACIENMASYSFRVPVAALYNGGYTLKIHVKRGIETADRDVSFSWTCPAVTFDADLPFGPGKQMGAIFESDIWNPAHVVVKLNTVEVIAGKKINPANPKEILFDLPKVGVGGFNDGKNTLRVERQGDGKNVLCIKTFDTKPYIINYIEKDFTWSCSSQTGGCDGDYVLSGPSDSGYSDTVTGCKYTTKADDSCLTGCADGSCKAPKLEITNVYIQDKKIGVSRIYEDLVSDRIVNVTVKNTGTMAAIKVSDHISAKLGAKDLALLGGDNINIPVSASRNYSFVLLKEDSPTVPLLETSVSATLATSASADNLATPVTWSKSVAFFSCGYNCAEYAGTSQTYCDVCSSLCKWVLETCVSKCGDLCGTPTYNTKTNCPKCSACIWNNVLAVCQPKA
ncbi:MAG: hypothetical protein ABIF85_06455 [Nanoarchaeota archaeon]|nr:hypothetical protein [Nanoarchaeota archaeon]MBU4300510.1 hypothetical protein [Nanoarchaeota archaeon]MBU4451990.1 hypothetical protein [Nanoarchaeota archaeon]MCG2724150.1 hypothetical protein [archaeon]